MTREKAVGEIARTLAQFSADAELLERRYTDLLKRHPWCYVGVYGGELYVGVTFQEVIRYFGDREHVLIRHLNPNPPVSNRAVA